MNASIKSLGIDRLSIEERLTLVEEMWHSIAADNAAAPMTDAQRIELQKRIEDDDAHRDDLIPWEQIKASTLSRLGK
jgi:putative addiction module component (TIGR02574 family)